MFSRFASSYNAKLSRFNSSFLQLGTEAVDAFIQDWLSENNWLVPPISLIGRLLPHMHESKAVGTLIGPMWKSSYFCQLLCSYGVHFSAFVADWLYLPASPFFSSFDSRLLNFHFFFSLSFYCLSVYSVVPVFVFIWESSI